MQPVIGPDRAKRTLAHSVDREHPERRFMSGPAACSLLRFFNDVQPALYSEDPVRAEGRQVYGALDALGITRRNSRHPLVLRADGKEFAVAWVEDKRLHGHVISVTWLSG